MHSDESRRPERGAFFSATPSRSERVKIQLFDLDRGFGKDDLMAVSKSDANGTFEISGYTSEILSIAPQLRIVHDCNNTVACQRRVLIKNPKEFITRGKVAEKFFDVGTLDLSPPQLKEDRDCTE
ncbi:hypothetical protein M3Y99_00505600 [Aphelenchoides fujianensis]|nr:hypothetical protein M3Y99_00505600 [Aphelenchoides fujianensis]